MPSRASYSFVALDGTSNDKLMDVSNDQDRRDILLAAQLSRIFCRLLEVEGFRKLERDFYNIKWKRISLDAHLRFLEELGKFSCLYAGESPGGSDSVMVARNQILASSTTSTALNSSVESSTYTTPVFSPNFLHGRPPTT